MGCRAKGRESQQRAVEAGLQSQGVLPGALGMGAVDVAEGHLQPTPAKPAAASPRPGASPRGLGAGAAVSSWRRRTLRRFPKAPHPPGTSQPWPRGYKTCWQQRPSIAFPGPPSEWLHHQNANSSMSRPCLPWSHCSLPNTVPGPWELL